MGSAEPPITNLMYADDLLLMGSAEPRQARLLKRVLQTLCDISGQRVSPEKSKIWFSKATSLAHVRSAIRIFGARFAFENETYLGGPFDVSRSTAFQSLLQKFDSRLHAWKARLLSPAGKLVLLKSVLEALPIYHMSTTPIHQCVLDKIQSKCVQFFLGEAG